MSPTRVEYILKLMPVTSGSGDIFVRKRHGPFVHQFDKEILNFYAHLINITTLCLSIFVSIWWRAN